MRTMLALLSLTLAAPAADMVRIAAGTFLMGDDRGELDERPAHRVRLSVFDLDRDEVTVAAYAFCVKAGACAAPRGPQGGADNPVTWVSFTDAAAYCRFRGRRLPTEAEWERAARGPLGRVYPWGDRFECSRGNFANYQGEGRCAGNPGRVVATGRYPKGVSREGARDLAGNVWEWVADGYDATYYARSTARDPSGPPPALSPLHVVRGGACCSMFGLPRAANRLAFPPDYRDEDIGFRCATAVAPR